MLPRFAGLVGEERLLAAGVRGFDLPDVGRRVRPVHGVDEDDARLAGPPRVVDDEVEDLADEPRRPIALRELPLPAGTRVDDDVRRVRFALEPFHERRRDAHRRLKFVSCRTSSLTLMKSTISGWSIRMVPCWRRGGTLPAGWHRSPGEDAEERQRTRGVAAARTHEIPGGAQPAEGEARAAARLLDHGGVLDRAEDPVDAVLDG